MICWGSIACLHATVKNYHQLMTLRFFLGFFEAGFFPGVVYFLTLFYKKNEMATRIALFWGSTVAAHAYGKLALWVHDRNLNGKCMFLNVYSWCIGIWHFTAERQWRFNRMAVVIFD